MGDNALVNTFTDEKEVGEDEINEFADLVATRIFGAASYEKASADNRERIRSFLSDFYDIAINPELLIERIDSGQISLSQKRALDYIADDPSLINEFSQHYAYSINKRGTGSDDTEVKLAGAQLQVALTKYLEYKSELETSTLITNPEEYIKDQLGEVGDFAPYFEHLDTVKKIRDLTIDRDGKFREDTPPAAIAPWQCRIGCSTFLIPPTSIKVNQVFKTGSLTSGAIRQANTPKTNMGHSETMIEMNLFFPNHESIWGFRGDQADFNIFNWDPNPIVRDDIAEIMGDIQRMGETVSDEVIDYFLSSLRGLVTQFKYAPFLPIKNQYLNQTYDITAVSMMGMSVTTVPDFPFVLQVNLQLAKFNFDPYLPMISDFDNAIHYGRFRQYLGRAAARLDSRVNQGFLIEKAHGPTPGPAGPAAGGSGHEPSKDEVVTFEGDLIPVFDKAKDLRDGRYFDIYYPVTTPSAVFAPDTTDFRQPGEDEQPSKDRWDFILGNLGLNIIEEAPQFNFFEYDRAIKARTSERELLHEWLGVNRLAWENMNKDKLDEFLQEAIDKALQDGLSADSVPLLRAQYQQEWFYELFDLLIANNKAFKDLVEQREFKDSNYILNEWKVPMEKLAMDWDSCIVNGVSINLSNNIVPQQIQLQDEPVHQHIGGGDSTVFVSMTVLGEANLVKLRRLFQHINGLARIERAHGVLGFLGIKNVITALCGIKYVLPIDFEVETVPGVPHAYTCNMSFIDFDIMQQEREKLSADQQMDLVENFGKRNPFLRVKQHWSAFELYPDLPLDVRDETGRVAGYLDPDWYFRAFKSNDSDLFGWSQDTQVLNLIKTYAEVKARIENVNSATGNSVREDYLADIEKARELELQILEAVNSGGNLPAGWTIQNGEIRALEGNESFGTAEQRQILGVYGDEGKKTISFIDFFNGGTFNIGSINAQTGVETVHQRMVVLKEDKASDNLAGMSMVPEATPYSQSQKEYLDEVDAPNGQFRSIMQDFEYRNLKGRMIKAFPTYMLWLIDEGGQFAGIKLFDNFYGLNSIIDFSVLQNQNALNDTMVLRVSNIYHKLTTPYNDVVIREDDPLYETPIGRWVTTSQNRARNILSGLFDFDPITGAPTVLDVGNVRLKPGVRIHLRAGYGSNPSALQTLFNGTITEVTQDDIMTIIAQSDAMELTGMVNSTNAKGHTGKIDGGLISNFYLSEPRDLMVRLLSMGSSRFKEWLSWGSKGVIFSESRFGIRHFGNILYEPMTPKEGRIDHQILRGVLNKIVNIDGSSNSQNQFLSVAGDSLTELSEMRATNFFAPAVDNNMMAIGIMLWLNQATKRDYEIYKRNIYPGNGTGIAQFMGGDMIDAGILVTTATALYKKEGSGAETTPSEHGPDVTKAPMPGGNEMTLPPRPPIDPEHNKVLIDNINTTRASTDGITTAELVALLKNPNRQAAIDIENDDSWYEDVGSGLLDILISGGPVGFVADQIFDVAEMLTDAAGLGGWFGSALKAFEFVGEIATNPLPTIAGGAWSTAKKISNSSIGRAMGMGQAMDDDDLYCYDEVAFRAQTYMKTVWDLFQTCAALLPNYIVAVRPFEDRSTVFYGKPHWQYTSGVIPISTGVIRDPKERPWIEDPDQVMTSLLNEVQKSNNNDFEKFSRIIDQTDALKDIVDFSVTQNADPYDMGSGDTGPVGITNEALQTILTNFEEDADEDLYTHYKDWLHDERFNYMTGDQVDSILQALTDRGSDYYSKAEFEALIIEQINEQNENRGNLSSARDYFDQLIADDTNDDGPDRFVDQVTALVGAGNAPKLLDLFDADPITFAYQFGWAFSFVPVYIDPSTGFGVDHVGVLARKQYDEDFAVDVDAPDGGKSIKDAIDIWRDFRVHYPDNSEPIEIFNQFFPTGDAQSKYRETMNLFMRFLWQDPFNRAWVVNAAEKRRGLDNTPFVGSTDWNWNNIDKIWEQFLSYGDITLDPSGTIQAPGARRFMRNNQIAGNTAGTWYGGILEDTGTWWDENVGAMIGVISDTITGLVASIRMSLAQLGAATSLAGLQQQQANILNSVFNDSRYYAEGAPGSLKRLVDNPFTREYGEPVIEVREPFQRVHYISSFDAILNNGIKENLTNVNTVVTAVSDGKNPVTVHFDKGVPPEVQTETTVETGLYWDNVFGSGLFGMFQPLIHPLEALRGVEKVKLSSSDQLSARRVALWHLKQNLQQIYDGEIIVQGDPDIRPYDLVYIGDVYSRMYGFVEVHQVIHHFTPENGFVTSITPNPVVTINDPVRWSMMSYIWGKMNSYNLRNDVRATMNVKAEREVVQASQAITQDDVYKYFSKQMHGAMQYTQGNTALIRDFGAMYAGGGMEGLTKRDEIFNQIAKYDIAFGAAKGATTIAGGVLGSLGGLGVGTAVGGTAGYLVGDMIWEGWQWVKNNLLDQHGCYIQYLNKDGEPMDAGLGYYKGVAAGTNHTISLFPNVLGINTSNANVIQDGHYRITTNDLLGSIGWSELDVISLHRETSMYVNQINSQILGITGREARDIPNDAFQVIRAKVLLPDGETLADGSKANGVIDGDTIQVRVDGSEQVMRIRLANVNTYELEYYQNPYSEYNELDKNPTNDMGRLAADYLRAKFTNEANRYVVLRIDPRNAQNQGRTVATVFHNADLGMDASEKWDALERFASKSPAIPFDAYLNDGRPYTLNWEMIMTGYANVDMRESLWNTGWRDAAITYGVE